MKAIIKKEMEWAGRTLSLEVGRLAYQTNEAVLARYGDTVVLATVVASTPREDLDYFPLRVDYEERLYAGGLIKTSRFVKRETRPTDEAIVSARLIDHAVRPLFPADYKDEVQLIVTVLSVEPGGDPAMLGLIAASAVLTASDIPWLGPLGTLRISRKKDGELTVNPPVTSPLSVNGESPDLDIVLSFRGDRLVGMEGEGKEVPEDQLFSAIEWGRDQVQPLINFIKEFAETIGRKKYVYEASVLDPVLVEAVRGFAGKRIKEMLSTPLDRLDYTDAQTNLKKGVYEEFEGKYSRVKLDTALSAVEKDEVRRLIFEEKKRPDGRGLDEIRPLSMEVGVLPRTHGTGLFSRGLTQTLTIATLGSSSLEQLIQTMTGEESKRYMHHYNAPPFSTGEVGPLRGPGRREIGHGALAEKALLPVIPSKDDFPYTIRLASEILSQNGSTSMASTCGSTLALMDAGVPIKAPVAGIALGLMTDKDESQFIILTDIAGVEDFNGFMDFKMAGTQTGMTALQMDTKLKKGLPLPVVKDALERSRQARLFVLEAMNLVIAAPRESLSKYAPRIIVIKIDPKRIGEVIGPGGKIIKKIIEVTGAAIDIDDDGSVYISSTDDTQSQKAREWIEGIVKEIKVGEIYDCRVVKITDFGAFVEYLPGKEGLVHISELSYQHVPTVEDVVKMDDTFKVKVIGIDPSGKVSLSKKALEERPEGYVDRPPRSERPSHGPGLRTPYYRRPAYRR